MEEGNPRLLGTTRGNCTVKLIGWSWAVHISFAWVTSQDCFDDKVGSGRTVVYAALSSWEERLWLDMGMNQKKSDWF